jgi:hypothetical protein
MTDFRRYFDGWSLAIIALTLVLFGAARFVKGLTHDLLLEAGVFLVSVKLVMMAYKNAVTAEKVVKQLGDIQNTLKQLESNQRGPLQSPATKS